MRGFGVFFLVFFVVVFNIWSLYDMTVHKETVSLMAEFKTQNLWKFRNSCGSDTACLCSFSHVGDTLSSRNYYKIKVGVLSCLHYYLHRKWRCPEVLPQPLQQECWMRGPQALQTTTVTSSHCSTQLTPRLSWQAAVTLRHHTSASTKHTFEKVWATQGTCFRGCQGKPALSINSREAMKQPRGTDTRTAGCECKKVFCFLCVDRGGEKWHSEIPSDQAKVGLVVSLNLPSGVKIQQITPQMCSFKQITSFFFLSRFFSFFLSFCKERGACQRYKSAEVYFKLKTLVNLVKWVGMCAPTPQKATTFQKWHLQTLSRKSSVYYSSTLNVEAVLP